MNLRWNPDLRRFEAEFHDFASEQPLVKSLGFKTDGPPTWVWHSVKAAPLTKLREKKPAVLTISPEARTEYNRLKELEDVEAALKAKMAEHKKELKKKLKKDAGDALKPDEYFDPIVQFICTKVEDKCMPPVQSLSKIGLMPEEKCLICRDPLFAYEGPKFCLWCQKIVLDNQTDL